MQHPVCGEAVLSAHRHTQIDRHPHTGVSLLLTMAQRDPFTAPTCKMSGLKDAGTGLQNSIFYGPIAYLLSMLYVVIKVLSHASAKKEKKRLEGFKPV